MSHPRDRHAAATLLLDGGKRVADTVYMHMLLVDEQPAEVRNLVMAAAKLAPDADGRFCVVRIALRRPEIGLLDYPGFFDEPFPALRSSWRIELDSGRVSAVDFSARDNPPILHRKELLLPAQHPERAGFACLTAELEDYGAFEQPLHTIGQRLQWERALASLGLKVENHHVVVGLHAPDAGGGSDTVGIARHRTAISRSRLSTPMRALAQWRPLRNGLSALVIADSLRGSATVARRRWVSVGLDREASRRRCCRRARVPIADWNASPA